MLNAECFVMAQSSAESNHRVRFGKQTSKQENTTSWMSFLLILITITFFSKSQCCRCSLWMVVSGKLLPSLSLGRAIHVSRSCQCHFCDRGAGGCPPASGLRPGRRREAKPSPASTGSVVAVSPIPCSGRPLSATISFNHSSWHRTPAAVRCEPRAGRLGVKKDK